MKIDGSNLFVTGGASGLGEATARALVALDGAALGGDGVALAAHLGAVLDDD